MSTIKFLLVVPVWNQLGEISNLLTEENHKDSFSLCSWLRGADVLLVDDYSTDETIQNINEFLARDYSPKLNVRVTTNRFSKGPDGARLTGFLAAKENELILSCDLDHMYQPAMLESFISRALPSVLSSPTQSLNLSTASLTRPTVCRGVRRWRRRGIVRKLCSSVFSGLFYLKFRANIPDPGSSIALFSSSLVTSYVSLDENNNNSSLLNLVLTPGLVIENYEVEVSEVLPSKFHLASLIKTAIRLLTAS